MKNAITNLINSTEPATLKINQFCTLHRWTKDAIGTEVDCLEARFSITHSTSHIYKIEARDWRGVVAELQEAQTKAFMDAAATYNKQLANGYIG